MVEERKIKEGEEMIGSDIKGYTIVTNNARILGELEDLIISDKTGKIIDIIIKVEPGKKVHVRGSKKKGDHLLVPFEKVEKVGEFIIVSE